MPSLPNRPCLKVGCPASVAPGTGYCPTHAAAYNQEHSANRPVHLTQLYSSYRWRKARATYLSRHRFCVNPHGLHRSIVPVVADRIDHILRHRGDPLLFWDQSNWQSLCTPCHNRKTGEEAPLYV